MNNHSRKTSTKRRLSVLLPLSILFTTTATFADPIEAYLSDVSVTAGDNIALYASTSSASYNIDVYKVNESNILVASYNDIAGQLHPTQDNSWQQGAGWTNPFHLNIPTDWPSGIYEIELHTNDADTTVNFIVKEKTPGRTSSILLIDNATTQMAYNKWGGKSLYDFNSSDGQKATSVSYLRPNQSSSSVKDIRFTRWADAMNITIEHASALDLHRDPTLLGNYQAMVITGHNEYWSKQMRDNYDNFVEAGGNAVILSGNTMWWQVRFEENNMVCYKGAADDPLTGIDDSLVTTNFSASPVNNPENHSIGLSFRNGGYVNYQDTLPASEGYGGYTITDAAHPILSGTGMLNGDVLGQLSTIVGYETDGALFEWVEGKPVVTGEDDTPLNFNILGYSVASQGHATMGIFDKTNAGSSGGTVFNAATIDWVDGLWWPAQGSIPEPLVSKITLNVLSTLAPASAASCTNNTSGIDTDGDGINDACDNCILAQNTDQSDIDGDLTGDVCDATNDGGLVEGGDDTPDAPAPTTPTDPVPTTPTDPAPTTPAPTSPAPTTPTSPAPTAPEPTSSPATNTSSGGGGGSTGLMLMLLLPLCFYRGRNRT